MDYPLKTTEQLRQQIRSLRKKRQMTQAQLGALIGVTQARVVEIEATPGSVSFQQVMKVLGALGAGIVIRETEAAGAPDAHPPMPRDSTASTNTAAPAPTARAKKGSW